MLPFENIVINYPLFSEGFIGALKCMHVYCNIFFIFVDNRVLVILIPPRESLGNVSGEVSDKACNG